MVIHHQYSLAWENDGDHEGRLDLNYENSTNGKVINTLFNFLVYAVSWSMQCSALQQQQQQQQQQQKQ